MSDENNLLNFAIGNKISILLENQNKKQKDLALFLDVNSNIISYWCTGARKPNLEQIIQIAKFFNVTTDYLLGISENKTTDIELRAVCEYVKLNDETVQALHTSSTEIKRFLDFALCSENITAFSDMCYSFSNYKNVISELIEKQFDFIMDRQIHTKEHFMQFYKSYKLAEEKIDLNEYKTSKAFINLLSLYKDQKLNDNNIKEIQKDFIKKWDKLIKNYSKDGD